MLGDDNLLFRYIASYRLIGYWLTKRKVSPNIEAIEPQTLILVEYFKTENATHFRLN